MWRRGSDVLPGEVEEVVTLTMAPTIARFSARGVAHANLHDGLSGTAGGTDAKVTRHQVRHAVPPRRHASYNDAEESDDDGDDGDGAGSGGSGRGRGRRHASSSESPTEEAMRPVILVGGQDGVLRAYTRNVGTSGEAPVWELLWDTSCHVQAVSHCAIDRSGRCVGPL